MNLSYTYTYKLLAAADEQRHGFIKLRGTQADHEVRLMADAGLVKATFGDGKKGSFTSINQLTATGQTFLRAFKNHPIPAEAALSESSHSVLARNWKADVDLGLIPFKAVA